MQSIHSATVQVFGKILTLRQAFSPYATNAILVQRKNKTMIRNDPKRPPWYTILVLQKLCRNKVFSRKALLIGIWLIFHIAVAAGAATAGNLTTSPFYLESRSGPHILSSTPLSTGDGFIGQSITSPITWTTAGTLSGTTVPSGSWSVSLWTNSPGAASLVRVDVLQGGVSIGNETLDVNASGGGNHPTTYSIPVTSSITFNSQTLGVEVTQVSGAAAIALADGDFPSTLTWSAGSGSGGGGGATTNITANPFYMENRSGPYILSNTALSTGDGFFGLSTSSPITWATPATLTSTTVPTGSWTVKLWTDSPGSSSMVRVDVLQGGTSIGNATMDVNASGGGNHTTTFSIPVTSAVTYNGQTLGVTVTHVSGAAVVAVADGDFPSTLTWTAASGSGGGSNNGGAGPSGDGGSGPVPTTMTFTFNNTSSYPNSQVYVMIIGSDPNDTSSNMSWYNAATGKFQAMQLSDNQGIGATAPYVPPSSWGVGSNTYCPYSFSVAAHPSITLPWITSSRMFFSYGYPIYMNNVLDGNGNVMAAEPGNPTSSTPNWFFPWDYMELNYGSGGLNVDTSRVDAFNIPSNFTLNSATGVTAMRGDLPGMTHAQYVTAYQNYINGKGASTVFGPCVLNNPGGKIVNAGAVTIQSGQVGANYYDAYINTVWSLYPQGGSNYLDLPIEGGPYKGQVNSAGQMVFTRTGDTTDLFYINRKPTSLEVSSCAGAFNDTTNSNSSTVGSQLAIQAAVAAAFNRTIADDLNLVNDWSNPDTYYQKSPTNYYSAFWHLNGYAGLAYGFPYDDENGQSSDCNFIDPTTLTVNMWY